MTERRMLEIGVRAVGIVILFDAVPQTLITVFSSAFVFSEFSIESFIYPVIGLVAFLLLRRTEAVAKMLSNSEDEVDTVPSEFVHWNRWLVAAAVVCGIATAIVRSVDALAMPMVYALKWSDYGVLDACIAVFFMAVAELAVLWWLFGAVVGQRPWLMGRRSNVG